MNHANPQTNVVQPETDLMESATAFVAQVSLPGVLPQDLDVTLDRDLLTVSGTATSTSTPGEATSSVNYQRAFRLPQEVDKNRVDVELKDGLLTVTLPKHAAPPKIRLPVKVA